MQNQFQTSPGQAQNAPAANQTCETFKCHCVTRGDSTLELNEFNKPAISLSDVKNDKEVSAPYSVEQALSGFNESSSLPDCAGAFLVIREMKNLD